MRHVLAALAACCLFFSCGGNFPPVPPDPTPTPTPKPCVPGSCPRELDEPLMCDEESGKCVACRPDLSSATWNTDLPPGLPTCSTAERPVKHWPAEKECPVLTEPCQDPLPQPQCATFTDRGGNLQAQSGSCNCWRGYVFVECPEPPPVGTCPFRTPSAAEMVAQGLKVEIRPKKEGRKAFGSTPLGEFGRFMVDGKPYYCQEGLWPEACAAGRQIGPVAPDGHPDRVACEQVFLQLKCSYLSVVSDEHMSMDPWISLNGVNQNHPRNVARGCGSQLEDDPSWVKEPHNGHLYVVAGEIDWATVHGNGKVCASAKDGVGKKCVPYVEE
jgi:hypothetical protein